MLTNSLYPSTSPYYVTDVVNGKFLDVMINRPIPKNTTDIYWEITQAYSLRPDLLAFDMYNDPKLWWVFASRNPNRLKDPLFDFVTGVGIYLPQAPVIEKVLGL
jgi:hypothetical protein